MTLVCRPVFQGFPVRYEHAIDPMHWFPHHQSDRFSRESELQEIAVPMNRHAVFIGVAGFQTDCIATNPAEIGVLELGLLQVAPSTKRADCKLYGRGQIVKIP